MSRTDKRLIGVAVACVVVVALREVLPYSVWLTVVSVLFGGAITALFSWYYYQHASRDLKDEATALREESETLRRHTTLILRGLEEAGLVAYNRDEQGEIPGIVIKLSGVVRGGGGMSGTPTVGDADDSDAHQR